MPLDETNYRGPFGDDIPDWREAVRWANLANDVQRSADDLAGRGAEPAARHALLRSLQQRRVIAADAPEDRLVVQFDFLPAQTGFDTLFAPNELLIARESYEGGNAVPGMARYLEAIGITVTEVACDELRGRVLRLIPDGQLEGQDLADLARLLRGRGAVTSLTNVIPTSCDQGDGVVKASPDASPEPSAGYVSAARERRERLSMQGAPAAVTVTVIDTGITAEIRADGWLDGVPRNARDIDPLDAFPLPDGDGFLDFEAGHGTFVAGIVQQVAPGARITVRRAIDSDGIGSEVTVACELIRAVIEDGAQIVNLSLGCQTQDDVPPIAIQAALDIIGEWQRESGSEVLVIAAAGNYADTRPCWPAAFRDVVSVAGLGAGLAPARWSSRGFWVDCATIGQGIRSTYVEGRQAPTTAPEPVSFGPDAWAVWTGTSFAAPQIAGAVANVCQAEGIGVREALRRLLAAGRPVPGFGRAVGPILPGV